MKNKRIIVRLFTILCALMMLTGCGSTVKEAAEGTEEGAEEKESVMFSNIKMPDSSLSDEEREMLKAVQKMLEEAEVTRGNDSYYVNLQVKNTTPYDLRLTFYLMGLDDDGAIRSCDSFYLDEWKSGARLAADMSIGGNVSVTQSRIVIEYIDGSYLYRTEPVILPLQSSVDADLPVEIRLQKELPYQFSVTGYSDTQKFSLLDFAYEAESTENKYTLKMRIRKDSALSGTYTSMEYRLVREDGVVVTDESVDISYLDRDEIMLVVDEYVELLPGSYTLEILGGS